MVENVHLLSYRLNSLNHEDRDLVQRGMCHDPETALFVL